MILYSDIDVTNLDLNYIPQKCPSPWMWPHPKRLILRILCYFLVEVNVFRKGIFVRPLLWYELKHVACVIIHIFGMIFGWLVNSYSFPPLLSRISAFHILCFISKLPFEISKTMKWEGREHTFTFSVYENVFDISLVPFHQQLK